MSDKKSLKKNNHIERTLNGDVTKLVDLQKNIIEKLKKVILKLNNLSI